MATSSGIRGILLATGLTRAACLQTRIQQRLHARRKAEPAEFVSTLELLEQRYRQADFTPEKSLIDLRSGTFHLSGVDALYRRTYAFKG